MSESNSSASETTPLILVVDDDRSMRSLLKLAMEEEGYRVVEAKDGEQGLSEYRLWQPDMVLLDGMMPVMDGFTCCRHLRQLPGGDRIPILTITVLDDTESVELAFAAGATDYITKPIHWSVLSQRVKRLLNADRALLKAEVAKEQLKQQQAWEYLCRKILQKMNQSSDRYSYIRETLTSIREFLQVERVVLYRLDSQKFFESVVSGYPSVEGMLFTSIGLETEYALEYQQGQIIAIDDIAQTELPAAAIEQFITLKTPALMMAPIAIHDRFWGLLCAHHCQNQRCWSAIEKERFADLAHLLAIAVSFLKKRTENGQQTADKF
jgi:DNA-binding response OmpR family regulator